MDHTQLPKIDMSTFVLSVSSAAMMGMGLIPPAGKSEPEINLALAKQNIDLLELLQEKTKGNLSADETQLIDKILFEVRLKFVEVQKQVEGASAGTES